MDDKDRAKGGAAAARVELHTENKSRVDELCRIYGRGGPRPTSPASERAQRAAGTRKKRMDARIQRALGLLELSKKVAASSRAKARAFADRQAKARETAAKAH